MMKFHKTYIPIQPSIDLNMVYNIAQISVEKIYQDAISKIENYNTLLSLAQGSHKSIHLFLKNTQQICVFHQLYQLKKARGNNFRTTLCEIERLTYATREQIKIVLYFLEKIKIISISNDVIFEIKYLNE
jgi:hypothetical protein